MLKLKDKEASMRSLQTGMGVGERRKLYLKGVPELRAPGEEGLGPI